MYNNYFNEVSNTLKIPIYINDFLNTDKQLLKEYENLDDKFKNLDILIINSIPLGNQYIVDEKSWDNFILNLFNNNFKIATTKKVSNINCTLDKSLSIYQIGAISTHSKIIIAINTGPTSAIFNIFTLNYVKKIYLFDDKVTFSYSKIKHCNSLEDILINELKLL